MSIMSYPDRGKWGDAKWRGNCSGHLYADLFRQMKPASFCDPMMGSGTSIEVAKEMGIQAFGLDLHSGFNVIKDSILQANGQPVDLCVSHPPYGNMIVYSGAVWGSQAHPDDLSRCEDVEDFLTKMTTALLNQRDGTRPGGTYGTLIGDHRSKGQYWSYQAELIARMPSNELGACLIKAQHNTLSGLKSYGSMKYPRIEHEYLILWQRPEKSQVLLTRMANEAARRVRSAWHAVVRMALIQLGGRARLKDLYSRVRELFPEGAETNGNVDAKVRQVLQRRPEFQAVERGVWALS